MKTKIYSILSGVIAFMLGGCSTDLAPEPDSPSGKGDSFLRLEINKQDLTRGIMTSFENGDSVFVVIRDANNPDPLTLTTAAVFNGNEWMLKDKLDLSTESESGVSWTSAVVEVYYPYKTFHEGYDVLNPNRLIVANPLDQEDILYGITDGINAQNPSAKVSCYHLKTRLTFEINNNSDSPVAISKMSVDTEGQQLFLGRYGFIRGGYFEIPDEYTKDFSMSCNIEIPAGDTATLDFLIPPTEIAYEMMTYRMMEEGISKTTLKFTLDGSRNINFDIEAQPWEPRRQYTYPVNLSNEEKPVYTGEVGGHEYVDLGGSVLWATCNLGADTPYESGLYYQWGEVKGYTADSDYWANQKDRYSFRDWNLNGFLAEGIIIKTSDDVFYLSNKYDAANISWSNGWRMPSIKELKELETNCSFIWDSKNKGVIVHSNITDTEIFLPAARYIFNGKLSSYETAEYWSSTFYIGAYNDSGSMSGNSIHIRQDGLNSSSGISLFAGLPIRPVISKE